jgi:flagellar protein FliO/FliZ
VLSALLLLQAAPPPADSYLADLLRTLLALAGVCALAWFGLHRFARRGYAGAGKGAAAAVRVLARVPLEARKSLYLVRAGGRVLLIGTGEAGPPALLAELDPSSVEGAANPEHPAAVTDAGADSLPPSGASGS